MKHRWCRAIALASLFLAVFISASVPAGIIISKPATEQIPTDRVQRSTSDVPDNILPIHITMPQFSKHKAGSTNWYSEPFYTHLEGYKLVLNVDADGHGSVEGTHVSVFLNLMRGEFDNKLEWPFQGSINIQLLNQMENKMHCERTIHFADNRGERVTDTEMAAIGWGLDFISHRQLSYDPYKNSYFLKNDTLLFRVVLQTAMTNVLPVQIAMTDFERHRQDSEVWYSEPFYTHPGGYKLYLQVYANGNGAGKGTHISVFRCLMQEENDNHLEWTFYNDVVIQLLNQTEDTVYYEKTAISIFGNSTCIGWQKFIPHHRLIMCYLKEDTLIFRIMLLNTTSILPCQVTMTDFETHKKDNDWWESEPFYTHQGGYRMFLMVNPNSSGTHVSVYATLARGKFNNNLRWPFRGDVTVKLLNQVEDGNHYKKTIRFTSYDTPDRVAGGINEGWGKEKFIPHNLLSQYLKEGSLQFHITCHNCGADRSDGSMMNVLPVQIAMTDFERHRQDSEVWYSEPFYTHPGGYKLYLQVYANGNGASKGTHVSVFRCLMQEENDNHLEWTFYNDVVIQLLNQTEDTVYYEKTAISIFGNSACIGLQKFIPHHYLNTSYLKEDTILFRVMLLNTTSILPYQITMTDFERHKKDEDNWYSEPFYTHPGGYRMYITINADGFQSGKGTHVSVFVSVARGKFDHSLKWPFRGNIIVKLINQKNDVESYKRTISFNDETPDEVADGEKSFIGWGLYTFVSHDYLEHNTQYLKDGDLQFNITYNI